MEDSWRWIRQRYDYSYDGCMDGFPMEKLVMDSQYNCMDTFLLYGGGILDWIGLHEITVHYIQCRVRNPIIVYYGSSYIVSFPESFL
jgi:hypothetical protein